MQVIIHSSIQDTLTLGAEPCRRFEQELQEWNHPIIDTLIVSRDLKSIGGTDYDLMVIELQRTGFRPKIAYQPIEVVDAPIHVNRWRGKDCIVNILVPLVEGPWRAMP